MNQHIIQNENIGINIRKMRLAAGLTQEELVAKIQLEDCDIPRSTYAKIEAGIRHIKVSELKAIARALKADYKDIFGDK